MGREGVAGLVFVNKGAAAREIFLVAISQLTPLRKSVLCGVSKEANFVINTEFFVIAKIQMTPTSRLNLGTSRTVPPRFLFTRR